MYPSKKTSLPNNEQIEKQDGQFQQTDVIISEEMPVIHLPEKDQDTLFYSLVVSFFSRGEGSDFKVIGEFENYLSEMKNKEGDQFIFEAFPWGREGEMDYCIRLDALSEHEKNLFFKEAERIASSSKLVHLRRNAECRYKNQR